MKNANNRVGKAKEAVADANMDSRVNLKFVYDKNEFATSEAVHEHLSKSDFEGEISVTETDDCFIVENTSIGYLS